MSISPSLISRSNSVCELCTLDTQPLQAYLVPIRKEDTPENTVVLCDTCYQAISGKEFTNPNYFHFLTGSIWSEIPAVKVLSYRILSYLKDTDWAQEALESAYLTEEELAWANSEQEAVSNAIVHKDAYGTILENGDSIFLTDNLNVKGANFTATKGTKVSKIRLVPDNAEQIEGKIEGTVIVILTKYVRKGV